MQSNANTRRDKLAADLAQIMEQQKDNADTIVQYEADLAKAKEDLQTAVCEQPAQATAPATQGPLLDTAWMDRLDQSALVGAGVDKERLAQMHKILAELYNMAAAPTPAPGGATTPPAQVPSRPSPTSHPPHAHESAVPPSEPASTGVFPHEDTDLADEWEALLARTGDEAIPAVARTRFAQLVRVEPYDAASQLTAC